MSAAATPMGFARSRATKLHKWMCEDGYADYAEVLRLRLENRYKRLKHGDNEAELYRCQGAIEELEALLGIKAELHKEIVTPPAPSMPGSERR